MSQIGVSVVSLTTGWSFVPGLGMPLIGWMARRAGFDFLQALPLRWVTLDGLVKLRNGGLPTRYVEHAWNPTTWSRHIRGEVGGRGVPTRLQDPLFFPSPRESESRFIQMGYVRGTRRIYDRLGVLPPGSLVEVHPGLGLSAQELVCTASRDRFGLVLDTWHIAQVVRDRSGSRSIEEVRKDIETLLPAVELIHIQGSNTIGWNLFLSEEALGGSSLSWPGWVLRQAVDMGYCGPAVVEYRPGAVDGWVELFSPWALADTLSKIRARVEEIVRR